MSEVLSLAHYRGRRARGAAGRKPNPETTFFSRAELSAILSLYSRGVMAGRLCDYAIESARDKAVFEVYGRRGERPLYRIVKRAGARPAAGFWVSAGGRVLRAGPSLAGVLAALEPPLRAVESA